MAGGYIEEFIGQGFSSVIGDPNLMGIIFLGFFAGFVMLQGTRLDGKVAILVPASLLALIFIPWLAVLLALAVGVLIYLAMRKLGFAD